MKTSKDKLLYKVLTNETLIKSYEYNPEDYQDLDSALHSENPVVQSIAMIIDEIKEGENITMSNLYSKLFNLLNQKLML